MSSKIKSYGDEKGRMWTACCECNRGGNGNAKDKCAAGWQCVEWNQLGCFLGSPIVGALPLKPSRAKQRYRRYLEYGDSFRTFLDFCRWDGDPARSWNGGLNVLALALALWVTP